MSIKKAVLSSLLIFPLAALAANAPIINEEQYALTDIEKLSLSLRHADIHILHDNSDNILIVHKQVLKKGDAEKCLYQLNEKHRSNSLSISNDRADQKSSFFNFSFSNNCSVEQDITITIGEGVIEKLNLDFGHSNATVDQSIYEKLLLNIAHSKFVIDKIKTNQSDIHVAHSRVEINSLVTETITFEGAHSQFTADTVQAENMSGDWAHGNVAFETSTIGKLKFDSAHSAINLQQHKGESLDIESAHGSIYANTLITDQAYLENRHGPIEFIGMPSKMRVSNAHGAIELTQLANEQFDITAENSHGNILLYVPKDSDYSYNLNNNGSVIEREHSSTNTVNLNTSHGRTKIKEH